MTEHILHVRPPDRPKVQGWASGEFSPPYYSPAMLPHVVGWCRGNLGYVPEHTLLVSKFYLIFTSAEDQMLFQFRFGII